jgi:hypothetical protein
MARPAYIKKENDRIELIVGDEPFLIIGFQWSCDLSSYEEYVESYLPVAKQMGCNTAVIPLYWKDVEPVPGEYRMKDLGKRIKACQKHGLKMVVLWFGSYKNAQMWYVPEWVSRDSVTYPRAVKKNGEIHMNTACPLGANMLKKDADAFVEVIKTIKNVDINCDTVIMVQVENEPGLLTGDRCYCEDCNKKYENEGWKLPEDFTATYIARYLNTIAAEGKKIYPILLNANAWLDNEFFRRPGMDYPSGGPNMRNMHIYRDEAPCIDFLSPDTYNVSDRVFGEVCRAYSSFSNVLYIAEHSAYGLDHRAEKNIIYALGEYGAIGFDPYCINNNEDPIVKSDYTLDKRISQYIDTVKMINNSMPAILKTRQTERLKSFVKEEGDRFKFIVMEGYSFLIEYQGEGRGMVIQLEEDEFVILGVGIKVKICDLRTQEIIVPDECEWGLYENKTWIKKYVASRESLLGFIPFQGPDVAKIRISKKQSWINKNEIRNTQ